MLRAFKLRVSIYSEYSDNEWQWYIIWWTSKLQIWSLELLWLLFSFCIWFIMIHIILHPSIHPSIQPTIHPSIHSHTYSYLHTQMLQDLARSRICVCVYVPPYWWWSQRWLNAPGVPESEQAEGLIAVSWEASGGCLARKASGGFSVKGLGDINCIFNLFMWAWHPNIISEEHVIWIMVYFPNKKYRDPFGSTVMSLRRPTPPWRLQAFQWNMPTPKGGSGAVFLTWIVCRSLWETIIAMEHHHAMNGKSRALSMDSMAMVNSKLLVITRG